MDQKALISNVLTAVVTAAVLGILGFTMGVFEKGAEAMSKDQIEAVLDDVLVTDSGLTHAQALAKINNNLTEISTKVGEIKEDVNDLEDAVLTLAGSD